MKLCSPALLYLVLSIIPMLALIFYDVSIGVFLVELFFVALWTWILNFFCKKGFSGVSWFLVLFPIFISTIAIILFGYELAGEYNKDIDDVIQINDL